MTSPSPAPFSAVRSRLPGGQVLVVLDGELDISTAPEVEKVTAGLEAGARLVIDLAGVEFVDSSGMNTLVRITRAVESDGGAVVLAAPGQHVLRVFEIVGLPAIVPVADSREAAVNSLSDGPARAEQAG